MSILCDLNHERWFEIYAMQDAEKDEVIAKINLKVLQRSTLATLGLLSFYVARYVLWNRGIGGKFFHYSRFATLPIYGSIIAYNYYWAAYRMLQESGTLDYSLKRNRFKRHNHDAKKILDVRGDAIKLKEQDDKSEFAITEFVNRRELPDQSLTSNRQ